MTQLSKALDIDNSTLTDLASSIEWSDPGMSREGPVIRTGGHSASPSPLKGWKKATAPDP